MTETLPSPTAVIAPVSPPPSSTNKTQHLPQTQQSLPFPVYPSQLRSDLVLNGSSSAGVLVGSKPSSSSSSLTHTTSQTQQYQQQQQQHSYSIDRSRSSTSSIRDRDTSSAPSSPRVRATNGNGNGHNPSSSTMTIPPSTPSPRTRALMGPLSSLEEVKDGFQLSPKLGSSGNGMGMVGGGPGFSGPVRRKSKDRITSSTGGAEGSGSSPGSSSTNLYLQQQQFPSQPLRRGRYSDLATRSGVDSDSDGSATATPSSLSTKSKLLASRERERERLDRDRDRIDRIDGQQTQTQTRRKRTLSQQSLHVSKTSSVSGWGTGGSGSGSGSGVDNDAEDEDDGLDMEMDEGENNPHSGGQKPGSGRTYSKALPSPGELPASYRSNPPPSPSASAHQVLQPLQAQTQAQPPYPYRSNTSPTNGNGIQSQTQYNQFQFQQPQQHQPQHQSQNQSQTQNQHPQPPQLPHSKSQPSLPTMESQIRQMEAEQRRSILEQWHEQSLWVLRQYGRGRAPMNGTGPAPAGVQVQTQGMMMGQVPMQGQSGSFVNGNVNGAHTMNGTGMGNGSTNLGGWVSPTNGFVNLGALRMTPAGSPKVALPTVGATDGSIPSPGGGQRQRQGHQRTGSGGSMVGGQSFGEPLIVTQSTSTSLPNGNFIGPQQPMHPTMNRQVQQQMNGQASMSMPPITSPNIRQTGFLPFQSLPSSNNSSVQSFQQPQQPQPQFFQQLQAPIHPAAPRSASEPAQPHESLIPPATLSRSSSESLASSSSLEDLDLGEEDVGVMFLTRSRRGHKERGADSSASTGPESVSSGGEQRRNYAAQIGARRRLGAGVGLVNHSDSAMSSDGRRPGALGLDLGKGSPAWGTEGGLLTTDGEDTMGHQPRPPRTVLSTFAPDAKPLNDPSFPLVLFVLRLLAIVPAVIGFGRLLAGAIRYRQGIVGPDHWEQLMALPWTIITGIFCFELTTGLTHRWLLYYDLPSTLLRLVSLQSICWPCTAITLRYVGDKNPLMAWIVVGTCTAWSRSVQIWVTSNVPELATRSGLKRDPSFSSGKEQANLAARSRGQRPATTSSMYLGFDGGSWKQKGKGATIWIKRRRWDWGEVGREVGWKLGLLYLLTTWFLLWDRHAS